MDPQLVDRIYECAFVPEMWPRVLEELAGISKARTGLLHVSRGDTHLAVASKEQNISDVRPLVESGWVARSPRVAHFFAMRHPGFLREIDVFKGDALEDHFKNDPTCRNILIPRGVGRVAATMLELPTADRAFISLDREWAKGPVEDEAIAQLDTLRPHVARAGLMSARLQLRDATIAGATLANLGLPAVVLDERARVLFANELAEDLRSLFHWRANDSISLNDHFADAMFRAAMESIGMLTGVRSFPVRDAREDAAMVAHVIPIRLAARDIFSRCAAALVLTPVTAPGAPPIELIQSLFDLTPTEARVARGLALGKAVDDIATDGGVSLNTVRTHVRHVLEKTGCNRQAEATALLGGVSSVHLSKG